MIYSTLTIAILLIAFYIIQKKKQNLQSQLSECSICTQLFHETEIRVEDDLPFCLEHYHLYCNSRWSIYKRIASTAEDSFEGVKLYEFKMYLWQELKIPSVLISSYEIKDGAITTILILKVLDSDIDRISQIEKFQQKNQP